MPSKDWQQSPRGAAAFRDMIRPWTKDSIGVLVAIMQGDAKKLGVDSVPIKERRLAAESLLDRGWGKPTQVIAGAEDMPPLTVQIVQLDEKAKEWAG